MKIDHVAIWVSDLEMMRQFYVTYFGAVSNSKYENSAKGFQSYFLTFDGGARLELMQGSIIIQQSNVGKTPSDLCHFALSVGSERAVEDLTRQLRADGFRVLSEPRRTGDGYYESVIADPDGHRIEITAG